MPRSLHLFLVCLLTQTIRSSMPNFIVDPGNIIRSGVNDPPGVAFVLTGVGKSSFKTSILTLLCNPIDAFFLLDVILDCPSPVWAVVGADNKTKLRWLSPPISSQPTTTLSYNESFIPSYKPKSINTLKGRGLAYVQNPKRLYLVIYSEV